MIKQFYFKLFNLTLVICLPHFKCQAILFNPLIETYQVPPLLPKLQHYWSLAIKLFSVINRTIVELVGLLPLCRDAVMYSTAPTDWGLNETEKV